MDSVIDMLAHVSANHDRIKAGVVAFVMEPTAEDPTPSVEILTIGEDAINIFGISELVKMQLFQSLGRQE